MLKCFYILATGFDDWANSIPVALWETYDESDGSETCARLVLSYLQDEFREIAPSRTFTIVGGTLDDTAALFKMVNDAQCGLYGDEVLDVCETARPFQETLERVQSIKGSDDKEGAAGSLCDRIKALGGTLGGKVPTAPDERFLVDLDRLVSLPYKPKREPVAQGESKALATVPGATVASPVAPLAADPPNGKTELLGAAVNAKMSASDLARKHSVNAGALRKRLDRWRVEHDAGYSEVQNRKRNEPQFLYDESGVMPVIDALKAKEAQNAKPVG